MTAAISRPPHAMRLLRSLLALTLACFALAAWADPPGRVGRVADTDGNVWLYDDEQGEWVQARRNRPITEGDRLSAERGARAEVQIGGSTLRIDGGTDVEFEQLDDARVFLRVHGGSAALRVRSSISAREFALLTDEGRYAPLQPGHYRVDVRERSSLGETLAGAMRFEARDSVLDLQNGQRAEFWQERGTTHYAWATPENDRFGDWVAREDRDDSRERHRYVSEEMTGAEDLDRHGRWDRHPDYGAIWYPSVVVAGWAPYRYGHWAHIRPWGWTWVDDAPWGFAPFHYGRWVHWQGRWGWAPGQYVARPVYAPALVAWFGGSNVSVGVSIGGPAVGWVPLAPREIYYPSYYHSPTYVRQVNVTHVHWHGPRPRYERPVPTGPIMYTNQGVVGGVTVVPQSVMNSRQPISSRVAVPVDARTVSTWQAHVPTAPAGARSSRDTHAVPPPAARVVATAGGAVPSAPNAVRTTQWGRHEGRVNAARGDGGQAPRRVAVPPTVAMPGAAAAVPAPPPMSQPQQPAQQPPQGAVRAIPVPPQSQGQPPQRHPRQAREDREERGERRVGGMPAPVQRVEPRPAQQVQQVQQPVPPAVVAQPQPAPRARRGGGDDGDANTRGPGRADRDADQQQRERGSNNGRDPRMQQQVR